jgi:hypothetical protein
VAAVVRLLGLPDALARFGLQVEVVPGWETRGSAAFNPGCTVGHHTAGSSRGIRPSLRVVVEGRSDLPGPLCNTYTDRNGVAVVVAAGRANHAGRGGFRGLVGNSAAIGHEAEDEGDGHWTRAQLDAFPRVHAAHLWLLRRDASWYCSHRTWTPRKPDPAGLPDTDLQRQIHHLLTTGGADMDAHERKLLEEVHAALHRPHPQLFGQNPPSRTLGDFARFAHLDAFMASSKADVILTMLREDDAATDRIEQALARVLQRQDSALNAKDVARELLEQLAAGGQ